MKLYAMHVSDQERRTLIEAICLAINETERMAHNELEDDVKVKLELEAKELRNLLNKLEGGS